MFHRFLSLTFATFILCCASINANATVILDFENANSGLRHIDQNGFSLDMGGQYGFMSIHNPTNTTSVPQNGTKFVQMSTQFAYPATLTAINGSLFELSSIDIGEYSSVYKLPRSSSFKGYTYSGTILTEEFWVDGNFDGLGGISDFETFTFGEDWKNLVKVEFGFGLTFDNIVLNNSATSVPEPTSLAILVLGLFGLFTSRKSRAKFFK